LKIVDFGISMYASFYSGSPCFLSVMKKRNLKNVSLSNTIKAHV
jgi:hypothetical protein